MKSFVPFLFFLSLLTMRTSFKSSGAATADTITPARSLRDGEGGDTIVSATEVFELGFFSPGNSKNRYLGIWYKNLSPLTVVWVANRGTPLLDSSGTLNLTQQGNLILLNRTQDVIWSSNSPTTSRAIVAQLLDSGNFVVREEKDKNPEENPLWQSFEHLCDTWLPGVKVGVITNSGEKQAYLTPWKSVDDPSPGDFRFGFDPTRFRELVLTQNSTVLSRTVPWTGKLTGVKMNGLLRYDFIFDQQETYLRFEVTNTSLFWRLVQSPSGQLHYYLWDDRKPNWRIYRSSTTDNCFRYALCGPFGRCNENNFQTCDCLEGFQPKYPKAWEVADWGSGCVRKTPLECGNMDGFVNMSGGSLPDTANYWYNGSMTLDECRLQCLHNCSCTAYANSDTHAQTGCLLWFDDLRNIRDKSDNPASFYVRVAASELGIVAQDNGRKRESSGKKRVRKIIASSVGAVTGALLLGGLLVVLNVHMKKMLQQQRKMKYIMGRDHTTEEENLELPLFDLATIKDATDNFSPQKILGRGGFGPVYKGVLRDGREIAVKRLSRSSKQGLHEFKNEFTHIAKLQHRNLVKLLGCCIEGDELMLVYEYMANKSLDLLIFGETKGLTLDWRARFNIINGVARGLMYLHQDSRLRIIHRDLKAGNILLDSEMNPKISDFGLARSFLGSEDEANTKRVVGTFGYMSPEYAIEGVYSTKSDVFSFGVLSLEVVSGKRNRGFNHPSHNLNLLGHAWKLHQENKALELIDAAIGATTNTCNYVEALRSIHMGLLCVQRNPDDRPCMSYVVQMLSGDGTLPPPKQPGFFTERDLEEACSSSSSKHGPFSANEISTTVLEPR